MAGGEGSGHEVAGRVMSGSASTESMARLEQLRYDSYAGRAAWEPGRASDGGNNLDDIDYMSEEAEDDEGADLSGDELNSGSDSLHRSYRDGRHARMVPLESTCRSDARPKQPPMSNLPLCLLGS